MTNAKRYNTAKHFIITLIRFGLIKDHSVSTDEVYRLINRRFRDDRRTEAVHRVGQKEKVTIIDMIARGTIEEKIKKTLVAKKEITKRIIDKNLTQKECMTLM